MGAKEHVVTSQGHDIGTLKSVDGDMVHLRGKDYWLPIAAIETIEEQEVRLRPDYDFLGGPDTRGRTKGFVSGATRLALLGLIARTAYTYRDERKRHQLMSKAKDLTEKAKTELNRAKSEINKMKAKTNGGGMSHASMTSTTMPSSGPSTRPFSSLDLSNRSVSQKETELIAEVTKAFPDATVRTDAIGVHKPDGGEVGTLRITVDERASSDIELSRLEMSSESAEVMAQEMIASLRSQMPAQKSP
jgi:hypothetical protein